METPPHAWGRLNLQSYYVHKTRNTPTCVGKTPADEHGRSRIWKHPHMRGEDASPLELVRMNWETPPHAWGRLE